MTNPLLASPKITELDNSTGRPPLVPSPEKNREGLSGEELSKFSTSIPAATGFTAPLQTIPQSELLENKRYPLYKRNTDLENIYGLKQPWYDKIANGVVKFAATGVGTFAQSFATIPNTVRAIKSGEISELSGDPDGYEASIDNWLKNIEDNFPNYYTRYEREHPLRGVVPLTTGSANFWGDKIIKNLGFTAGAISGALVQDAAIASITGGIGEIPLISAQLGKASLWLNKIFASSSKIDDLLLSTNKLIDLQRIGQTAYLTKLNSGVRYATSLYGSARTEAAIEARDSYDRVKQELTDIYKLNNLNDEPTPEEAEKISKYAEDAMNTRFGVNMALLTVSNAVQFGNLFKSYTGVQKALNTVRLKEGSLDVFTKVQPKSQVWEAIRPKVANVFSEGIYEEGGQFATEKAVFDYYTRKYKSDKDTWNDFNETVESIVHGLKEQFGSTEGIENMLIGGISGIIAGGITGRIETKKQEERTQAALNVLNRYGLTGTLSQQYKDTLNSAVIAKEMQEAATSKDPYKYQNLQSDLFFNYVYSRIPSNMHDVTVEQLRMLNDLSKEEFEKTFGMDFTASNKETVQEYVSSLIGEANIIKTISDGINLSFNNPYQNYINPKSEEQLEETKNFNKFNEWKENLAYYAYNSRNVDSKVQDIQSDIYKISPLIDVQTLSQLTSKEGLKSLSKEYENRANALLKSISDLTPIQDKRRIRNEAKQLRTASEKINITLNNNTFGPEQLDDLLNLEVGERFTQDVITLFNKGVEVNRLLDRKNKAIEIYDNLSSKEGFEKFISQEDIQEEAAQEPSQKLPFEIGREYENIKGKLPKIKKTNDDRFEISLPDGTTSFFESEEEAENTLKEYEQEFKDISKVKVLGVNTNGTIKIEDINGDIYDISLSVLEDYTKVVTEQEKLQKVKSKLDKEQSQVVLNSGDVATNSLIEDINSSEKEDMKKPTEWLFTSTTSVSEDWDNPIFTPHIRKLNTFINNLKNLPNYNKIRTILITPNQEVSLGLSGISDYSLQGTDIEKTNIDNGLVLAIYVEQDGNNIYYINEEGKRLSKVGENTDIESIVFSTMPTTSLYWSNGEPRYRKDQEQEAIEQSKRWRQKREQLFNLPEGKYEIYEFSVSRGIPIISDNFEENKVGNNLVPEKLIPTQQGLIQIPTTGTIAHQGQLLKYPNGRPVLQYKDTLQFLNNRKFTKDEAQAISNVIANISDSIRENKDNLLNKDYVDYLQNLLFWKTSPSVKSNQIFIDTTSMEISIGTNRYEISKVRENLDKITSDLQEAFISINNKTLTSKFNESFIEFYIDNDELKSRKWRNYQTYLLSSSFPDKSKRNNIPLTTSVDIPTEAVPYNFKQKYAILQGIELPELTIQEAKPLIKEVTPKIDEYILDGSTVNTYQLNSGPVQFTGSIDKDNNIEIEVIADETIEKIVNNSSLKSKIFDNLKKLNNFDESLDDTAQITTFVALQIGANLKSKQPKKEAKIEVKPKDFSNVKGVSNPEYRRVAGETDKIDPSDIVEFVNWHKVNVPAIPFYILENIVITHDNQKAWGVFEDGVAKFYKSAARGTEYHEIFEGIWSSFLTKPQQQELLDEFKSKTGTFKDRQSNKNIKFSDATDLQAKERIADDFADFRLGKLPAKNLGERIVQFFRAIIDFFKQFVQKPSKKESLFEAINSGKFKDYTIPTNQYIEPQYKRVQGLTEQQTNEFVQDMTARFFQNIFGNNKSLYSPDLLTSQEIFNSIKESYVENGFLDNNNPEKLNDIEFDQLVSRTKDFLRTFKIEFDEDNNLSINDEGVDNRNYSPEPFSTNWKKSSPFVIKILLASLIETEALNQSNSINLDLPSPIESSVSGYKLLNFSRGFATVMEKLSNTTDVNLFVDKIINLAKNDSNYVRLFTRLGGDRNNLTLNYSKLDDEDWRTFIQFYQVFSKQKPNPYIQYINNGEVYSSSADINAPVKIEKQSWIENMKSLSKKKGELITYNKTDKTYQINDLSISIKTPKDQMDFLSKIGVQFPSEIYKKLNNKEKEQFSKAVSSLYTYIRKEKDILSINGKTLGIDSQLTKLAELIVKTTNPNRDITYIGIDGKRLQSFTDNNAISIFENDFNSSSTIEELLKKRPELNDIFSENSLVLKRGGIFFDEDGNRIKSLKTSYIQGTVDTTKGSETVTSKLSLGDRLTQEINQNIEGNYYIIVPADSSTEWMLNLDNQIKINSSSEEVNLIFRNYLKDDINLALDNRGYLKNVRGKENELRFFREILSDSLLEKTNSLITSSPSQEEIEIFIAENSQEIDNSIQEYLIDSKNQTKTILLETGQLKNTGNNMYSYTNINDNFIKENNLDKYNLSEDNLDTILNFVNTNYIINNIELHKILFGDPYQFAVKNNQLDETKRIKSFLSPRRTTFNSPEFTTYLNEKYNKAKEIVLTPEEVGYHLHKDYLNTVTLNDVDVFNDINKDYSNINEADAASWIMDRAYREVKLRNGQWSEEAENFYQWEMAYTRQNMPGYEYTNSALEKQDIKTLSSPRPSFKIEVLKPIVSGNKYGKNHIDLVLHKFSQIPIFYSSVEGTAMEDLYIKMNKESIDYAVMISGVKVGAEKVYNLYNKEGKINEEYFTDLIQVPWSAYGIQVENSYNKPKEQTRGSQITKLSSLDLFNEGRASEEATKEYSRNRNILSKIHQNAYKELLNSLGIEDLDGNFRLIDNISVSQVLQNELLSRDASENLKDIIQLDETGEFKIPFEASSSYIQIKDILYSMVDKAIVSPKMSGSSNVQVPATLWEDKKKGREVRTINGKKVFTSSELKFYTKEEPYCEILLPAWFKDKINRNRFKTDQELLNYLNKTEDGRNILKGIGFRIPTQSLSSIEVFRVKGFLPEYMGNTVVVPSEITTKAGSDFDIDKLNLYLKSVYIDQNGDIRLVKYMGSEEATKDHYSKIFDKKLENKRIRKNELLEALQIVHYGLEDKKQLIPKYADILNSIVDTSDDLSITEEKLLSVIEDLGNENLQKGIKEKFIKEMYKRALENDYYDSLEKLLTLPENFDRLISPVGDAGLKDLSSKIEKLKGQDETKIKNRLLNRPYMTSTRHAFVTGKKWVGIAAVNITGHSLTQKADVHIDYSKIEELSEYERRFIKDGEIVLPHNKNEQGLPSISFVKTANGKEYISDRLSGYATAFVDVAKDPYILKLIKNDLVIGTFMFLERLGVGENTALFLNQPIIDKYLSYLESIGSRSLYNKGNLDYIRSMFPTSEDSIEKTEIDVKSLQDNIKRYYEKGEFTTESDNAVQRLVLDEFLKYSKMAEYSFKLTQASNYDTTKFRSSDTLYKKQIRTQEARRKNIFSSVDKILRNSFIGDQADILSYSSEALGEILKLDKYDIRETVINPVLEPFAKNEYLSNDKYDRIANRIITSFIDYISQTKSTINSQIRELVGEVDTSIGTQLAEAKKKYPQLRILRDLEITGSDNTQSVRLKANLKDAYDENIYTEMMRELRGFEPTSNLYRNLVKISIIQGTYRTSISIGDIIPVEDRSAILAPIIFELKLDQSLEAFAKGAFQRNNWKDPDIFLKINPRFFAANDFPIGEDRFGNEIYQYTSPSFPNIPSLSIKASDRKILQLNELYNPIEASKDFLIVPRVIEDPKTGEKIDLETGRTITPSMFVQRRLKGDRSLQSLYGYQKVKYENGEPVTTFDKNGNSIYIYKLINLWGDGIYASEYYETFKPSILDNNTVKIKQEIPDADIINYFSPKIQKESVSLQETVTKQPIMGPKIEKRTIQDQTNVELAANKYLEEWIEKNPMYYFPILEKNPDYEEYKESDAIRITIENYKDVQKLDKKIGEVIFTKKDREFVISNIIDPMNDYISYPITSYTSTEFAGFKKIKEEYNKETDPEIRQALEIFAKKYGLILNSEELTDPNQLSLFGDDQIPC